ETAADENSTAYFPLLDRIAEGYFDDSSTTEATYLAFLRLLQEDGHLTDAESLSSFQFALSIHSTAPRIEAHYQYYKTSAGWIGESAPDDTCESWVLLDGQQYCEPELDRRKGISASKEYGSHPYDAEALLRFVVTESSSYLLIAYWETRTAMCRRSSIPTSRHRVFANFTRLLVARPELARVRIEYGTSINVQLQMHH
ncbi:hypothetical protein LTR28_010583, partial [Elasticomyces elasticus]